MSSYAQIDPIIEKWVAKLGTTLFTEWGNRSTRCFHVPGDPPFECFQIVVRAPENDSVTVHATAINTNDDTEYTMERTWIGSIAEFNDMPKAAVETIDVWKSKRREKPDPPSPWK